MARTTRAAERLRLEEQTRLDSLKLASDRNKWGQFATPPDLARSIAEYALKLFRSRKKKCRFLEPAIGTGAFLSAFRQVFPNKISGSAVGIELDPDFAKAARSLWESSQTTIIEGDFTKQQPITPPFDLIMTNPPYVRHHHLGREDKERLQTTVRNQLDLSISGLAGLYCYFFLLSHQWLANDGVSIWLIPSEFMDVNYGITLRKYLTEHVTLIRIHRFCPSDVQFCDALVSSAIVVFRNSPPPTHHQVDFTFGGSLQESERSQSVPISQLKTGKKWTRYPQPTDATSVEHDAFLSELFSIKRGLATGSNEFFIMTPEKARALQIPKPCLKPILPSPRYLPSTIIEADKNGYPAIDKKLCLMDCDHPEEKVKSEMATFWDYLSQGKEQGIHERYLTSRRTPWYSQENRPPSPFLCTYMGRHSNGSGPFRFIWNKSQATATNVYLMLYPKGNLKTALSEHQELYAIVFEILQGLDSQSFIDEGRVYGGGLYKVEPKELGRLPGTPFLREIKQLNHGRQLELAF